MTENSFWNSFTSGISDFADGVSDFFNIGSTISASADMNGDDVVKTKSALNAVGRYDVPNFGITKIPDNDMIDGLKNFQANNGLKVDGVMKPGGPTENALGQTLANSGISATDLLEKAKTSSINPTPDVPKPTVTPKPPQTSWSASAPLGEAPKPTKPKLPKIDPMTGLEDPLASAPKGKMPTSRQWEEVAKIQQQKVKSAIIPQGDTVDQRIRSMMADRRYGDQHDTRLRDHVVKQFERAYPGKVEYDETGKMVQPTAVITPDQVEAYDPDGELSSIMQNNEDGSYTFKPESVEPDESAVSYTISDGAEKISQTSSYKEPAATRRKRQREEPKSETDLKERRLRGLAKAARKFGLDEAANSFERSLDGETSPRMDSREKAREHKFVVDAEEQNRKRFEENTFLAAPSQLPDEPKYAEARRRKAEMNRQLRNLQEGESMIIQDNWAVGHKSELDALYDSLHSGGIDQYLDVGKQSLNSESVIKATRRNGKIVLEGTVHHNADDLYDFRDGWIGDALGAKDLQDAGRLSNYKIKRGWKQRVTGTIDIGEDENGKGYKLLNPKIKWSDMQ